MDKYRSLFAWQQAHKIAALTLTKCDGGHPRSRALFDQLRRAAVSIEANIVEGYALGTTLQFKRHLRIAMGSAAEAECLTRLASELKYLQPDVAAEMAAILERTMAALYGLLRKTLRSPS